MKLKYDEIDQDQGGEQELERALELLNSVWAVRLDDRQDQIQWDQIFIFMINMMHRLHEQCPWLQM